MNLLGLIKKMAYGSVVVKRIDNVRSILAEVNFLIPFSLKKLRHSVNKVGGEDL